MCKLVEFPFKISVCIWAYLCLCVCVILLGYINHNFFESRTFCLCWHRFCCCAVFVPGDGVGSRAVTSRLFCLFIHISTAVMSVAGIASGTHHALNLQDVSSPWVQNNLLMPRLFFFVRPRVPEAEGGDGVVVSFQWWEGNFYSNTIILLNFTSW